MVEPTDEVCESQSRHENVSGHTILLQKRSMGKSLGMEYIVEKEKLSFWQSSAFCTISACLVLISLSVCISSAVGTVIFTSITVFILYNLFWKIEREVLLVTVPIGFQFTTFFNLGKPTTCFIPWHCIKDVYIVEAISLHRVLYNLVILTDSQGEKEESTQKLIPLFQGMQPRLSCLESIYQSLYSLLPRDQSTTCET